MSGWEQYGRRGIGLGYIYVAGEIPSRQYVKLSFLIMDPTLFTLRTILIVTL